MPELTRLFITSHQVSGRFPPARRISTGLPYPPCTGKSASHCRGVASVIRILRNSFISGILLLAPVAVTLFIINLLIQGIGAPTRQIVFFFVPADPRGRMWLEYGLHLLSFLIVILLITVLGWLSKRLIGRGLLVVFERIVDGVPGVRIVYNTVKQIRDVFVQEEKAVFQQVALIEFPRRGLWAIAFLTGRGKGEIQARTKDDVVNLFVPTTPNPTSGFLVMAPRREIHLLDMSVGDGMKLIISGGAVAPPFNPDSRDPTPIQPSEDSVGTPPPTPDPDRPL